MRRESATELENPLSPYQKRLLEITCEIYWFFFSIKSLSSRIQSISGTVRPSCGIHQTQSLSFYIDFNRY